ncbi:hypothetical protein PIB30_084255 [Stylosanthes scabra]|uniref:Replication protein A 70 kDa DNA-binding subunit B/D first OB fold domain-containing protein n=1 Tax=Stylosanthes scabra TaxID=79078 RepID=A0ABU6WQT3_9FABA|nr:hypothetical protein [Stylosanthes scabra]
MCELSRSDFGVGFEIAGFSEQKKLLRRQWDESSVASSVPSTVLASKPSVDWVADVNPSKVAWSLVVGVVHLYEMANQHYPSSINSLEMVLQDERDDRIHCTVPKKDVVIYKSLLKENDIYSMKNFFVQGYGKALRTTGHKFRLSFCLKTCVARLAKDVIIYTPFHFEKYPAIESMAM